MPRDLADVLHHFLPESSADGGRERQREAQKPPEGLPVRGLPIIGVPIGDRDVVRAAFTWNLAVEIARTGARASVIAPATDSASALWPEESNGPFGADVVLAPATYLGQLYRAASEAA